jgi:hypothetical protein
MHDVGEFVGIEEFRHDDGVAAIAEHSDFHRGDVTIFNQGFELSAQLGTGRVVNRFNALGVLNSEGGDCGDAVATMRGKSFQVGGGTGTAGRIEPRNR